MKPLLAWLGALAVLAPAAATRREPADRVFVGGRVWTADPKAPWAQAFAVRGPLLAAVGSDAEVRRLVGERTELVDLAGRLVTPGFNDAHLHYSSFDEDLKGTFTAGKRADFVVLSADVTTGPPERLLSARVLLTVMDGRDTHREPDAWPAQTPAR